MTNIRNEKLLKAFGEHIKQKRMDKKLTQEEFAELAGVETRQIGRIERGEVNCTISTIYSVSKALKIKMGDLMQFTI